MLGEERVKFIVSGLAANPARTSGPFNPGPFGINDGKVYNLDGKLVVDCLGNENNAGFFSHAANSIVPLLKHAEWQSKKIDMLEKALDSILDQLSDMPVDPKEWLDMTEVDAAYEFE